MQFWTNKREAKLTQIWNVEKLSATECAAVLGISRSAVMGKVHRLKLDRRAASPVKASKQSGGNGSAGKYRGVVAAARKARAAKVNTSKPERNNLPPPDIFTPEAGDLAVGAWNALPGSTPVSMEALARDGCRWPIGEDSPFLFCGCKAAAGSSYCATHKHRSVGKGTTDERMAPRSLKVISHLEVKNGFRSKQAGQNL